ncbi:MAG: ECF-type sigma factor [Verrucomicrobiota bacterium]
MSDVTRILDAIQHGDPRAADELLSLVYQELRKLAAQKMAREQPGHTLQATALVHEAWLSPGRWSLCQSSAFLRRRFRGHAANPRRAGVP